MTDYTMKISAELAERLLLVVEPHSDDWFRLSTWIQTGKRDHERFVKEQQQIAEADARWKATRDALPLSKKGTFEECATEFNRLRRLYNLSWCDQYDLASLGGVIIYDAAGEWMGTSQSKAPSELLGMLETFIASGRLSEPFVGPIWVENDSD